MGADCARDYPGYGLCRRRRQEGLVMKSAVFDYESIARTVNRQEQKAEFEAKNPQTARYGWIVDTLDGPKVDEPYDFTVDVVWLLPLMDGGKKGC
jgi:hypothetical protein